MESLVRELWQSILEWMATIEERKLEGLIAFLKNFFPYIVAVSSKTNSQLGFLFGVQNGKNLDSNYRGVKQFEKTSEIWLKIAFVNSRFCLSINLRDYYLNNLFFLQ